uniref:Uncharacterized protein n=1 Tax=Melanopsichium pennsylvanicum 4 TaxID=1398559 RepID=A0A077R973_9BASI|nr:uncharacterized protein BN887_06225 [Melanopsichium pennsylvanicum 4]
MTQIEPVSEPVVIATARCACATSPAMLSGCNDTLSSNYVQTAAGQSSRNLAHRADPNIYGHAASTLKNKLNSVGQAEVISQGMKKLYLSHHPCIEGLQTAPVTGSGVTRTLLGQKATPRVSSKGRMPSIMIAFAEFTGPAGMLLRQRVEETNFRE